MGVVFILSVRTGQVLNYEVMSLFCHECAQNMDEDPTTETFMTKIAHGKECQINNVGSTAAMESIGPVTIFLRSVNRGLRYTAFVGDGDSSCYGEVYQNAQKSKVNLYSKKGGMCGTCPKAFREWVERVYKKEQR